MLKKYIIALAVLYASCVSLSSAAFAFGIEMEPLSLNLHGRTSGTFRLHNTGTAPLKVQVDPSVWTQSGFESMQLKPTDDLVFYPPILTIAPLGYRTLRVGLDQPTNTLERAYRVTLSEVSPAKSAANVQIATKFTLPIYGRPADPHVVLHILSATAYPKYLEVQVRNDGNVHTHINTLAAVVKSGMGATVATGKMQGWYLLAKSTLTYRIPLDHGYCTSAFSAEIALDSDDLGTKQVVPTAQTCNKK